MMKKEDSKKHCKEEKRDLRNAAIYSFLLFLFSITSNLFPQIPINGFCRYREFSVQPGYTNLFAIDYNSDGYRDLLAYNPQKNIYSSLTSDLKSNFGNATSKSSSIYLTSLHLLADDQSKKSCIVLSRKTRELCEVTFSPNGSLSINAKQKLDGFPSSIDIGKISSDDKNEILVSGSALDGMKIFSCTNRNIKQVDDIKGEIFPSSIFSDLNYDSFADIVAYDLNSRAISFYINNGLGDFEKGRSIKVEANISEIKAEDYNSDGFVDLMFLKNGQLNVYYGDSVSSFKKQVVFHADSFINKYSVFDFNGDGYNDIAFINKENETLSISYCKGSNEFFPPIVYLKKSGLCDITSYVDRGGRKLAALSTEGKIFLISYLQFQEPLSSVSLGISPTAVQAFDYGNDSYEDIAFIDAGTRSLKIGLSERKNLFRAYYDILLSTNSTHFLMDDKSENEKTFICYKYGERFLELVRFDFASNKLNRLVYYLKKSIKDLKFVSDRLTDRITINVLVGESNKLFLQSLDVRNFKVVSDKIIGVAVNADESYLHQNVYKEVYYLYKNQNQNTLVKSIIDDKVILQTGKIYWESKPEEKTSIAFASSTELFNRSKSLAALITTKNKSHLYYFAGEETSTFLLKNSINPALPIGYYIDNNNEMLYFIYDKQKSKMFEISYIPKEGKIRESILMEMKGINYYFINKLDNKNKFLIFTNGIQNTITLKRF